jgi:hypothetical protein
MRGVIKPGAKFVLYVSFRPGTLSAQNACLLDRALRAWLLLGSLGTRSRRGFGSVWPIGGDLATPASLDELATALMDLGLPSDAKVITLNDGAPQVDDVLESAGQWLKQWRAGSDKSVPTPDRWGLHDHDATLGLGGKTTTYRQALGLPMTQRYSDDRGTFESRLADGDRWASPVHMKVARVGGKHVPVVVFLPSMAPPEGSEIFVSSRQTPARRKLKLDHGLLKAMMTPPQGGRLLLG